MRVLVLGGSGMLGHKVYQTLLTRFPETACTMRGRIDDDEYRNVSLFRSGKVFEEVDGLDLDGLEAFLGEERPSVLVNCIGIIKQRAEAGIPIQAITINSLLPHRLAEWTGKWGGRVIHFSTDCVFSGSRGGYTEADASDAEDLYGKSKFLGEVSTANALTLRTSIIGRELSQFRSLLEWFLSQKGTTVKGYTRVMYSGVTTNSLAELVVRIIERHPTLCGLYQVSAVPISKHDLLVKLREAYRLDVEIVPDGTTVSDRSLVSERLACATGYTAPAWNDLVAQLAADTTPYESWRQG